MKKTNRIAALLTAAVLTLSLAACGGGGDKAGGKDPLAAAKENMSGAKSMDISMVMDLDMEMGEETIQTVTKMESTVFDEPMKMKAVATTEAAGQSASVTIYAEETGDKAYTMYVNDGTGWISAPATAEDLTQYEIDENMSAYIDIAGSFRQEGTETVDGVSAYKYTGVITGANMKEFMTDSGALNSLSSLNIDSSQLDEMLSGDIPVTLWISEADLYPVRYEIDMTAVMDGLMQAVVESLGKQTQDLSIHIPKMSLTMTCSNFNSAADFSIPDEAKS